MSKEKTHQTSDDIVKKCINAPGMIVHGINVIRPGTLAAAIYDVEDILLSIEGPRDTTPPTWQCLLRAIEKVQHLWSEMKAKARRQPWFSQPESREFDDRLGAWFKLCSDRFHDCRQPADCESLSNDRLEEVKAEWLDKVDRCRQLMGELVRQSFDLDERLSSCQQKSGETGAGNDDGSSATKDKADWQDVQKRLLEFHHRGEEFTSFRKLAKRLGVRSTSTVSKAINNSDELTEWKERHNQNRITKPRASSLNEGVQDNAVQHREADPAKFVPDDDVDTVMARLIEEASPKERARLNAMTSEERRTLAEAVQSQSDDDCGEQLLGRRP